MSPTHIKTSALPFTALCNTEPLNMSEESITKRLDQYKEKVKENFTVLVEKTFPEKILELNELLESEKFSGNRFDTIHVSKIDIFDPVFPVFF